MNFLNKIKEATETKYYILMAFFTSALVISPMISNRIVEIFGIKAVLGAVLITIMYGIVDVINNDFGIIKAKQAILISTVVKFLMFGFISLLLSIPVYKETPGFEKIISTSLRMFIAGEATILISQYFIDTYIFDYFKQKYNSFVISYTLSNVTQIISTALMIIFGFWGTGLPLLPLFIGNLIYKYIIQIGLTPVYMLLTTKKEKLQ